MEPQALLQCATSMSCLVTQMSAGLIVGSLLFLMAAGLTLIFGVLNIVNFAHGSFYMLGAYFGLAAYQATGSFVVAVVVGGLGVGLVSVLFERFLIRRVYDADLLMQLLVCYGLILIIDDLVQYIWGADFRTMGMPEAFQHPPVSLLGSVIPVYYVFLMGVTLAIALLLWYLLTRTKIGKIVRAASVNPTMTSALGLDTFMIYMGVAAFGGVLAGLAGVFAAPMRSLTSGMGFSILIDSFIVTVVGGMGSISGALVGALLIGMVRSFGSVGAPDYVQIIVFLVMIAVLVVKPEGLIPRSRA